MTDRAPLLDLDHLARYTGGDPALEAELFDLFTRQAESCLARLAEADGERDWKDAAHTLKGAARGIGAMALGEACADAESRALDPDAHGAVRQAMQKTLLRIREVLAERG